MSTRPFGPSYTPWLLRGRQHRHNRVAPEARILLLPESELLGRGEAVADVHTVAAKEVGGRHRAFAGGLKFKDFECAVAGGDEEVVGGVEDRAGRWRLEGR